MYIIVYIYICANIYIYKLSPKTNRSSNKNTQEFRGGISYQGDGITSKPCWSALHASTSPMKRKKEGPEAKDPLFSISYVDYYVYIYV